MIVGKVMLNRVILARIKWKKSKALKIKNICSLNTSTTMFLCNIANVVLYRFGWGVCVCVCVSE